MKLCVVIPHYDHFDQFNAFLPRLLQLRLPLIVVDDASPGEVANRLASLLASCKGEVTLIRHAAAAGNRGKGGAVMSGLRAAFAAGFTHALQIDADGQHDLSAVAGFIEAANAEPDSMICGQPLFDGDISALRYYARYITLFLSHVETLSRDIRDAMCGFRLYPLQAVVSIINGSRLGERMAFDPEILVRVVWAGLRLKYLPVKVAYPKGGRSHFAYVRDNVEIAWMHTRLLFGMLWRLPMLLVRKWRHRQSLRGA